MPLFTQYPPDNSDIVKMLWYIVNTYCDGTVNIPIKDMMFIQGSIEVNDLPDGIQIVCKREENKDALPSP